MKWRDEHSCVLLLGVQFVTMPSIWLCHSQSTVAPFCFANDSGGEFVAPVLWAGTNRCSRCTFAIDMFHDHVSVALPATENPDVSIRL